MVSHPDLPRGAQRHSVEPWPQQLGLVERAGSPRQDEERGLKGVLGGVPVAEDLLAYAQYHRSMPADQGLESDLGQVVATGRESRQQLTVTHSCDRPRVQELVG
jgi:hypothetical protein